MWIWLQAGFLGFVAMFYMLARSLILGASKIRRVPDGPNVAILSSATIFIAMFFVFAFVDIAWDARNTTLLGICFAMCANYPVPRPTTAGGELSRPEPAVVGARTSR
jgi:O-antigen ligase